MESSESSCCICNDEIFLIDDPCRLMCGHLYHVGCIQTWFLIKENTCPQCRSITTCQHASNAEAHLKPYLFELIRQQKETIRQLELKVAECQNLLYVQNTFGNNNIPQPAFSFRNQRPILSRANNFEIPGVSFLSNARMQRARPVFYPPTRRTTRIL